MPAKACGLCGSPSGHRLFRKFGYPIVQCDRCALVYCDHQPSPDEVIDYYSEGYFKGEVDRRGYYDYEADETLIKASFTRKVAALAHWAPRMGRLLDVGCAAGFFMEVAHAAGWEVVGTEASPFAASAAARRGLAVVHALSPGVFAGARFEAVTMWDVIEHLPDPLETMKETRRLLVPGGVLGLCTGRIDSTFARMQGRRSRIFNPPQHLYFFSRASIRRLLARAGFEVLEILPEHKVVSLRYLLHLYVALSPRGTLRGLAQRVMASPFNPAVPVWIPDNMVVLARRR